MPFKRSKKNHAAAPDTSPVLEASVSEHIAHFEQRHRELLEEAGRELEKLKHQLSESQIIESRIAAAQQPLLQEIATLRSEVSRNESEKAHLVREIQNLHEDYRGHYSKLQGALSSLKDVVHDQTQTLDQQVKLLSLDTESAIDHVLASLTPTTRTEPAAVVEKVVEKTAPLPTVTDDNLEALLAEFSPQPAATQPVAQVVTTPRAEKPKKRFQIRGLRRLAIRTIAIALVLSVGWVGLKSLHGNGKVDAGQVAGVSTTAPASNTDTAGFADPAVAYKESRAIVPFAQTEWATYTDPDFGFTIRWPSNATNRVKTVGSSNIWFLRFDSYMMKISFDEGTDTVDQWWAKNSGFYTDEGSAAKSTFKNLPAWIVTPLTNDANSGTTYIVPAKTGILQIWVKSEDPTSDDGQRLTKMLDSLTITN